MGLSIKGYLLEPPRVGRANSPFTFTPNDVITNQGAFNAAYPTDESASRTDYCVVVQTDGLLANGATFGWTKNEDLVRRFDYDATAGSFKPLPGSAPDVVGELKADANTNRLKVIPPAGALVAAPFRLFLRTGLATDTFPATLVPNEGAFGSPALGTVEIALDKGTINWNPSDITANVGETVRFQRQSYFSYADSTGLVGDAQDPHLLLNPLPGPGQYPRIRLGFGFHLTPIEVLTEAGFSPNPASGTVEWARDTGRLKLNATDVVNHTGKGVFYDGVLFSWKQSLPQQSGGTVSVPTSIPLPLPFGSDLIFRLNATGYQFPYVRYVTTFDAGTRGEVQVRTTDGAVQYSAVDQSIHSGAAVTVFFGDLPIERGVSMRFYRSTVNLDGSDTTVKDVAALYGVTGATLASPIIQVPFVILPAVPVEDPGYPLTVTVEQGTGSFTGPLPDLGGASPPDGLGYIIDHATKQLNYAQRKGSTPSSKQIVTFAQRGGTIQLPDFPARREQLLLEVESAPGVGNFTPLVEGVSMLFDPTSAIVTLTNQTGQIVAQGSAQSFSGTTLTDSTASFLPSVQAGYQLVIPSGAAAGVYTVVSATATTLTTDVPTPSAVGTTHYEVRTPGEVVADRFFQELVPIDPNTYLERIRALGAAQNQTVVYTGVAPASFTASTTLVDTTTDFVADGVLAGDVVVLLSGPDTGSYRRITIVEATKLTVDQAFPFTSFTSANYRIERRLHVLPSTLSRTRVRLGPTVFATLVTVPNNGAFTSPAQGTVEVSAQTGDLNFSLADVTSGVGVYWGLRLRLQYDFKVSKDLGFIELTERLLTNDELYVTYRPVTDEGVQPSVTEHVGFLVRKEVTQPWPRPATTNQVVYNPAGRTVATEIPPQVWRGGRPQDDTQVLISTNPSTVTFLPNQGFMTDALPSGSSLEPDERVYLDYYVYEAVGGERSFNVLQPPIYAAQVIIRQATSSFVLVGNQTATFPPGYLLRVELQQVYLIGTSTYDSGTDLTTVTLAYGASFQDDFTNPKLYLSSGPIPLTPVFPQPSYFLTEMAPFGAVPRGMPTFQMPGDQTLSYAKGTVVLFTNNATYYDLYLVSGASFKDGVTTVTLQQNVRQQYTPGLAVLKRSVRPVLEDGVTQVQLEDTPIMTQGVTVFRRVSGQPGVLMTTPADYTLDASGTLKYAPALQVNEALSLFYTSYRLVEAGTRIRASYTSLVTPSDANGLLGQILKADYTLYQGDSFYYRVETLTNFSGEVMQALQASAQSSSPSGGPTTSNASSPTLYSQGSPSLFFTEGHTANVDYVSRKYLKFFNDNTHRLEDVLQDTDGRIVGDVNGRFRFDGLIGNPLRTSYAAVTNEIDDLFQVSPFPVVATIPPFPPTLTYLGTNIPLYQQSAFSRLYPTQKAHVVALTTAGQDTSAAMGDVIGDFKLPKMTTLPGVLYRRLPRARVIQPAAAGSSTLYVDHAHGDSASQSPPFAAGMVVVLQDRDGTFLVSDAAPLTVVSTLTGPERIDVGPLPVDIPRGATIYLCTTGATPDTTYWKLYRTNFDVGVNADAGQLTFIKPYPPLDGSVPLVPADLQIRPPNSNEFLEMDGVGFLQLGTTPYKFPALYGETLSDCGDQSIPIQSPTPDQEIETNADETGAVLAAQADVTLPVTLTGGTLDVTGTIITYPSPFPAPVPELYDLVEFKTGPNAGVGFRRIMAVNLVAKQVTVDLAFPTPSTSGNTVITSSANMATPGATATVAGTVMTDLATFASTIHPGHTVVFTSGLNTGVRRQVVAVTSSTTLTLDHPVPSAALTNYRVSNHLRTYSNWGTVQTSASDQVAVLTGNDHNLNPAVIDCITLAITRFLEGDLISQTDGVLTDLLTPASNPGTVSGTTLTGLTQDFYTAGVNTTSVVYIQSGSNAGFYAVQAVPTSTTLTVATSFPVAGAVTYRVVKPFGVGVQALQDLFGLRASSLAWSSTTLVWEALLAATAIVTVSPADPNIYANKIEAADLTARLTGLAARYGVITNPTSGPGALVDAIVKTRDKLYDKRYAWIDARVNVETGSLYVIQRAVADRVAAQVKLYNDLLKLLSVQTV